MAEELDLYPHEETWQLFTFVLTFFKGISSISHLCCMIHIAIHLKQIKLLKFCWHCVICQHVNFGEKSLSLGAFWSLYTAQLIWLISVFSLFELDWSALDWADWILGGFLDVFYFLFSIIFTFIFMHNWFLTCECLDWSNKTLHVHYLYEYCPSIKCSLTVSLF